MSESSPLAIIGISCLFPKAEDLRTYWGNIKNGVDAISPIPERSHWKIADYFSPDPKAPDRTYAKRGGFLSPVDFVPMDFGIAPKDVEATDTTQLLGMMAAKQALADAGYADKPFPRERTSVILGVTGALELVIPLGARLGHPIWRRALQEAGVGESVAEDVVQRISDAYVGWQENSFPGLLGNVAAGRIANRLDLGGTNCVVDAACASSLAALHLAGLELAAGRSDMVITGGLDTFNNIFMYLCFSKTPALSPSGDAKPFDRGCDGTILGEGLGMLVLKRLADAERDGDRIYAVIKGIGSSSDGKGNAIYAPRAEGQRDALRRAYADAGITPDTVELVEAHGTGTRVGDATEVQALTEVFREARPEGTWAALGSVKSQIGHTKAAAGVAGLIKAALALDHKVLPPTIKISQPVDELGSGRSPFYLNTQKRPWLPRTAHPRRAGVSAFGFGGTNFHCVLEEHGKRRERPGWDGDIEILACSGERREEVRGWLDTLSADIPWAEVRNRACRSRQEFKSEHAYRLLLPVVKGTPLAPLRDAAIAMIEKYPEKASWVLPSGIAFGSGERRGKLGMLFPGQGSQYVGMLRDLACQFPAMMESLAAADESFAAERGESEPLRLSDFIYPHPVFEDGARRQQEIALRATDVAQPALGAIGLGALGVLAGFGVTAEATAGHSYGELLALCAAGRLEAAQLHQLSNARGRLMAGRAGAEDRGAMLAVQTTEAELRRFLEEQHLQLIIANRNSPSQFVLAGSKAQIEQAAKELEKQSVRARVLPVAAAFHSPLVADARDPFATVLAEVPLLAGRLPVYANSTAALYPVEAESARELLANQMVQPVDFTAEIRKLQADGVATFLEVGPGHVLTDLVQAILPGKEVEAVALDASKGARSGTFDLAATLCRLAALGHKVELTCWEDAPELPKAADNGKVHFTLPLTGANYRSPVPQRPPFAPAQASAKDNNRESALRQNGQLPKPVAAPSLSQPTTVKPAMRSDLGAALQVAQQGMLSLQKLQEQTAQLHRQFLEGQDAARRTLEALLDQRRELLNLSPCSPRPVSASPSLPVGSPSQSNAVPAFGPVPVLGLAGLPAAVLPVQNPAGERALPAEAVRQTLAVPGVAKAVLAVVAEKTGYPVEMLNLDMGLDSDLGVDSIKRVEIMAALRGRLPSAPEIKPEHLGSLQTLQQVVEFLGAGNAQASPAVVPVPAALAVVPDVSCASEALLAVVAEKTGYPVEMLNLDMGLDSDLGVDSIKRVEIMAAIRGRLPSAPEIKPEHLGTLQTLRQVVEFLTASPQSAVSARGGEPVRTGPKSTVSGPEAAAALLKVVAEKTGYPVEMLNLEMGLDSDLGVDSIKRVEIMAALRTLLPAAPEIKPEHLGALQTLKQVVDFLTSGSGIDPATALSPSPIPGTPEARNGAGHEESGSVAHSPGTHPQQELQRQVIRPVRLDGSDGRRLLAPPAGGRIWITDDGSELAAAVELRLKNLGYAVRRGSPGDFIRRERTEHPAALVILWPATRANGSGISEAFRLMQAVGPSLRRVKDGGILMTVSRLDGVFGFGSLNGNGDPVSGGLAGLLKTARHEWPEVHCKAIDLNPEVQQGPEVADAIVEEMFRAGPVEVGLCAGERFGLELQTVPLAARNGFAVLKDEDLVVVTGGGRGITAKAILELARLARLRLVLLGRSLLAESEPEWLAGITDAAELKRTLLARSRNGRAPKQIEAKYREVLAQREIRRHLQQIRATGSTAMYRSVDVRDAAEVEKVFREIREQFGPVRGLVHGAGVLADRKIEDKTVEQFELVYGTKVAGLENLMRVLGGDELKLLALFSSYTGRFGRTGQVDYAAANEVLNKIAQSESRRRPQCRVVSFNWGPWNGGMVSDGLRKIFESEGVGLIEPEAGAEFFVREICSPVGQSVEVLALAPGADRGRNGSGNGNGAYPRSTAAPAVLNLAFEREVSVEALPCLGSHVLNGRAVVPAVLMIEWLAHGAVHGNPGMAFCGFEHFKVHKGLVLEPGARTSVSVLAEAGHMRDGLLRVQVQLVGLVGGRTVPHARAEILLAEVLPAPPVDWTSPILRTDNNGHHFIYGNGHLFHGPHFQGIEALEFCSEEEMAGMVKSAPAPKQWIRNPLRPTWMSDPLALDSSFQMLILWSWEHRRTGSLPCAIGRFRQFTAAFPKTGSRVVVRIDSGKAPVVTATLQFLDRQGKLLALVEGYECVLDQGLGEAFRRNRLPHEG
jgi:acyl transferase domain-containing protein/NAD(P)-dependent dehydrogenase (short-subunit alcohol dehydrogenase family)